MKTLIKEAVNFRLFFGSAGGPGSKLPLMGNARPWAGLWECGAFRAVPWYYLIGISRLCRVTSLKSTALASCWGLVLDLNSHLGYPA